MQKQEVVLFGVPDTSKELKAFTPELKVRMNKGKQFDVKEIKSGHDAFTILKRIYPRGLVQEHFIVLLLNRANRLVGFYRHTIGSTNATLADIPMIVAIATKSLAQSVIISHNHPSGNANPSEADKQLTTRAKTALTSVGITLLDHIIFTDSTYYSFSENDTLHGLQNSQTMITLKNLLAEYQDIPQDMLPEALQQSEFAFIEENIDLYHEDDTIKQYIDTFIDKLNQIKAKQGSLFDDEQQDEPQKKSAKKQKKQPGEKKQSQAPKEKKQKPTKKAKQTYQSEDVEFISAEVRFIKRFGALHGKSKTKKEILTFINSLQRAIVEKRIRKTSGYADIIEKIQEQLIECYNSMHNDARITITEASLEKYKEIAHSETVSAIVRFMKGVISIQGKPDMQKRAFSLFKRIQKAVNEGDISQDDVRFDEIKSLMKSLANCVEGRTETVEVSESILNGLQGFLGLSGDGLGFVETQSASKCISSTDLARMEFETIGLTGKYKRLIGDPSVGFMAMVYGLPKSGKSTLSIDFARHLAQNHGRVLYAALEEGFGYTLKEKFKRLNAIHPNLVIAEKLPENLSSFNFVFIDSVSKAGMTIEQLVRLHKQFPRTAFIFIFHSTKDGNFRGGQQFAHEVDCIIDVANGVAKGNGRFGVGGEINVFEN